MHFDGIAALWLSNDIKFEVSRRCWCCPPYLLGKFKMSGRIERFLPRGRRRKGLEKRRNPTLHPPRGGNRTAHSFFNFFRASLVCPTTPIYFLLRCFPALAIARLFFNRSLLGFNSNPFSPVLMALSHCPSPL